MEPQEITQSPERRFQEKLVWSIGQGERQSEQHKPTLEKTEGRNTTGNVSAQSTGWNVTGRGSVQGALTPAWASSPTARWSQLSLGTEPPPPAPLWLPAPRSKFDFEFCGLRGHRGPRGLEERLQDGVGVHLGRRVGGGGGVRPARQLALLSHRGAVTQPPVGREEPRSLSVSEMHRGPVHPSVQARPECRALCRLPLICSRPATFLCAEEVQPAASLENNTLPQDATHTLACNTFWEVSKQRNV